MINNEIISDRINKTGPTSGFDYLRIILALGVLAWHSIEVTNGAAFSKELSSGIFRPVMAIILPMFFALSGFLVTGSLERTKNLLSFLTLRIIRLVPALSVEILLSALILGPILTTYYLGNYFLDTRFFAYFLNIIGVIHYELPGVFENNIIPNTVNMSLWTIPYELECYIAISALYVLSLTTNLKRFLFPLVVIFAFLFTVLSVYLDVVKVAGPVPGRGLVLAFLVGACIYLYKDVIILSTGLAVASLIASILLLSFPIAIYFSVIPIAYLTVYLGMSNPHKVLIVRSGDYSYGMYLFAYPIQQFYVSLIGSFGGWFLNFGLATVTAFCYAMFSWHCVEKPILGKRHAILNAVTQLKERATFERPRWIRFGRVDRSEVRASGRDGIAS